MDLNLKHKSLKSLEKKVGENIQDLGKEWWDLISKRQSVKGKITKI